MGQGLSGRETVALKRITRWAQNHKAVPLQLLFPSGIGTTLTWKCRWYKKHHRCWYTCWPSFPLFPPQWIYRPWILWSLSCQDKYNQRVGEEHQQLQIEIPLIPTLQWVLKWDISVSRHLWVGPAHPENNEGQWLVTAFYTPYHKQCMLTLFALLMDSITLSTRTLLLPSIWQRKQLWMHSGNWQKMSGSWSARSTSRLKKVWKQWLKNSGSSLMRYSLDVLGDISYILQKHTQCK